MGFLDSDRKGMVEYRSSIVKDLAKKMGADYYYGVDKVKSDFCIFDYEMNDSNVIVGNKDGYDYCFVEYYHERCGKSDYPRWVSTLFFKMKNNNLPSFHLTTKSSAFTSSGLGILQSLFYLIMAFLFIYLGIDSFRKTSGNFYIFATIMGVLFGLIGVVLLNLHLRPLFKLKIQSKYGIRDKEFLEKYIIISEADPAEISKVFTEEVCSRIVNSLTDVDFDLSGCIVTVPFNTDSQLSYSSCKGYLDDILYKAKIFEKA